MTYRSKFKHGFTIITKHGFTNLPEYPAEWTQK